ncbi:MAG TPA: DUF47 family protein [Anaeromyxobacteraceae bacterium]|nr:DUF47 family protein [Anaeromyxobacteraceae bacterium]
MMNELGERALLLPEAVNRALSAHERAEYCLALLDAALRHARDPAAAAPDLRARREAVGLEDPTLDDVVPGAREDGAALHVPEASRVHRMLVECLDDMIAPLAMAAADGASGAVRFRDRLHAVLDGLPPIDRDRVPSGYLASLHPNGGDGLRRLVTDLHGELDRVQEVLARDQLAGAVVYGLDATDRDLVQAFMDGVNRTAPLKFDHPGLGTTAVRAGPALLVRNEIGGAEAHVLVLRVVGLSCSLELADPHLQRARFFQTLLAPFGVEWSEVRSREPATRDGGEALYRCAGQIIARDRGELERFLTLAGSRVVFLIDWNRARKRLRNFVDGPACVAILRWAADQNWGHRAFLQLGGERLVFEAMEHASPVPLRYGQRLDEVLGRDSAVEFLEFVLRVAAEGLLARRSERFVRDEIRAELAGRFETLEHGVLALAADHARVAVQLAAVACAEIRRTDGDAEARRRAAATAAEWERRADAIVARVRGLSRHSASPQALAHLLSDADDAVDALEEAVFLLTLTPPGDAAPRVREPLLRLAVQATSATEEWVRCLESAARARRHRTRDDLQEFLEAVERVSNVEHRADEAERALAVALFEAPLDARVLTLGTRLGDTLEGAVDALARCTLSLRDHVLGEASAG